MNRKKPNEVKRHHVNLYLNDEDKKILDIVMDSHKDVPLDRMLIYSLKKIYNKTNFPEDYNAILIKMLSERQSMLMNEIEELEHIIERKRKDLTSTEETIREMMKGENGDE